jgi:hypothetical protein
MRLYKVTKAGELVSLLPEDYMNAALTSIGEVDTIINHAVDSAEPEPVMFIEGQKSRSILKRLFNIQ